MGKMISVKSYDGKIVRIEESKLDEFNKRTEKIKQLISEGKTLDEITKLLKEGKI